MSKKFYFHFLLTSTVAATAIEGSPSAHAQSTTEATIETTLPLSTFCPLSTPPNLNPPITVTRCETEVIGTLVNTVIEPATFAAQPNGTIIISGVNNSTFDGSLQINGIPLQADGLAASTFITQSTFENTQVDLASDVTFDFDLEFDPVNGTQTILPTTTQTVNSVEIRAINVGIDDEFITADGNSGSFSVSAVDPTNIVNAGVELSGNFISGNNGGSGPIVLGSIAGTATLIQAPSIITTFGDPGNELSFDSVAALVVDVDTTETTVLSADGLITPTIAVTDGINLNNSQISNLADGVAPSDAVNRGQLDALANVSADADDGLQDNIDAEAASRIAGDAALQANLDTEQTARATADSALQDNIDAEAASRTAIAEQLDQRIAVNSDTVNTLVSNAATEQAARIASDNALSTRIDAFSGRLDLIDGRLDQLEDRVASSTAVATALSGNAFLPDTKFNLTANVSTYDGAQAGALQMGVLVSQNVALNAGVASGFNKGGKTAGRVGMTIGW